MKLWIQTGKGLQRHYGEEQENEEQVILEETEGDFYV